MVTILFNRDTLAWSGTDRTPLLSEIPITIADVSKFKKDVVRKIQRHKTNEYNQPLYLIPVKGKEETVTETISSETTDVTDTPLIESRIKVTNVTAKKYQAKELIKTTEVTDKPVYSHVLGEGLKFQETDIQGNPLYWTVKPNGSVITAKKEEVEEYQKRDEFGKPLYLQTTSVKKVVKHPDTVIEVTQYDPRYVEGLPAAIEVHEAIVSVDFENSPQEFNVYDAMRYKNALRSEGTFGSTFVDARTISGLHDANSHAYHRVDLRQEKSSVTFSLELKDIDTLSYPMVLVNLSRTAQITAQLKLSNGTVLTANSKQAFSLSDEAVNELQANPKVALTIINMESFPVSVSNTCVVY